MAAYVLLICVPATLSLFFRRIGGARNAILTYAFFTILFLLLCFRDFGVGTDIMSYEYHFNVYSRVSWNSLLPYLVKSDPAYVLLNKVVASVGDFRLLLVGVATICIWNITALYAENKKHQLFQMILFINMATFVMLFSGLRQSIAFSIGVRTYQCVREKKRGKYLLLTLLAGGFHSSAFVLFLLYPVYYMKIRKNHLWIVIPIIASIYLFSAQIFTAALQYLPAKYIERYDQLTQTGAYSMVILFIVFSAFAYVITQSDPIDEEIMGLRNILLLAIAFQCFAPIHSIAMRFNYYFIILIPYAMTKILKEAQKRYYQAAILAEVVICIVFALYFFYDGNYGADILNVFPYVLMKM